MKPPEFFRTDKAMRILRRAWRAAGVPVGIHFVQDGRESLRIVAFGQCAACKQVSGLPNGRQACRDARIPASLRAMTRGKPLPFLCHMGFSCVSMAVLPDEGYVLTFGPYCPLEAQESLDDDIRSGLDALGSRFDGDYGEFLSDIRLAPASAIPEIAEWTAESLNEVWRALPDTSQAQEDAQDTVGEESYITERARRRKIAARPVWAPDVREIVAALAAGNLPQTRSLVEAALPGIELGKRLRPDELQLRALVLMAAVMDAAKRAAMSTAEAWASFQALVQSDWHGESARTLCADVMKVIGHLKRKAARRVFVERSFDRFNRLVMQRLSEGVVLSEIAQELGEDPSAITHRLQRKFGMSFSEYVGRLRVTRAKELLRRTRLRVADVARRVGIADAGNLSKLFRRVEGLSPQEYRVRFRATKLEKDPSHD